MTQRIVGEDPEHSWRCHDVAAQSRQAERRGLVLPDGAPTQDPAHCWRLQYFHSELGVDVDARLAADMLQPRHTSQTNKQILAGILGVCKAGSIIIAEQRETPCEAKLFMKKLMTERGAPIPRLLHASSRSPELPFGPPLPLLPGGYVVKPAHLAESAHVFVIDAEGTDLLTGRQPTWEEVQGNMTEAWGKSLAHYDQARVLLPPPSPAGGSETRSLRGVSRGSVVGPAR